MNTLGVVVASTKITLVEGDLDEVSGKIHLIKDETFDLEDGDRAAAYRTMHKRLADRMCHGITRVVLMASSAGKFTGSTAALQAAELRGVLLSAVPKGIEVSQVHRKILSRDFGSRKVAEYTHDESWWKDHFDGLKARKGSRDAAFLLLCARE